MNLQILYVEDEHQDYAILKKYADKLRRREPPFSNIAPCTITITWAATVSEFKKLLQPHFDIILADIFLPINSGDQPYDNLTQILDYTAELSKEKSQEKNTKRLIPVIAYSGRITQSRVIDSINRDRLYDILDKNTASPEYVIWRLFKLAQEIYKNKPDTYLQSLIREMEPKPKEAGHTHLQSLIREMEPKLKGEWHTYVVEMANEYHSGLTEADQVIKAGTKIKDIANTIDLDFWKQSKKFWGVMERWEPLSRAISPNVRGHARHVINVFWLGYYILLNDNMRSVVDAWLDKICARNTTGRSTIQSDETILLKIWFVASIFHDIANCVEKSKKVYKFHESEVLNIFSAFFEYIPSADEITLNIDNLRDRTIDFCARYNEALKETVKEHFLDLLQSDKNIDHGLASSLLLIELAKNKEYNFIIQEAARAIALHNIIGSHVNLQNKISWDEEPIACLLILCDQLQTWDRERGDSNIKKFNKIESAELTNLQIDTSAENGITVQLDVNYNSPYHVQHPGGGLYDEVKEDLKDVLRSHPYSALEKINKPWPFKLEFTSYMDMRKIDSPVTFGA